MSTSGNLLMGYGAVIYIYKDAVKSTEMNKNDKKNIKQDEELPGYPPNPPSDDIYARYQKEKDGDTEELFDEVKPGKKAPEDLMPGAELDVPGAELDDEMEAIGSEDEENNYYSLGEEDANMPEDDQ
ncbi:MAG: hypothetical protein WCQ70_04030 [Lentimicrobiaceae bacterium]